MRNEDNFENIFAGRNSAVSPEMQKRIEKMKRKNLAAVLRKNSRFAFFVSLPVMFYFFLRSFGVKATLSQSLIAVFAVGAVTAGGTAVFAPVAYRHFIVKEKNLRALPVETMISGIEVSPPETKKQKRVLPAFAFAPSVADEASSALSESFYKYLKDRLKRGGYPVVELPSANNDSNAPFVVACSIASVNDGHVMTVRLADGDARVLMIKTFPVEVSSYRESAELIFRELSLIR